MLPARSVGRCPLLLVLLLTTRYPLLTLLFGRVTLRIYNLFVALKSSSWRKTILTEWCLWDTGAQITMIPGGRLTDAVKGGPSAPDMGFLQAEILLVCSPSFLSTTSHILQISRRSGTTNLDYDHSFQII